MYFSWPPSHPTVKSGGEPQTLLLRGPLQVPSDYTFAILADRYGRSARKTDFDLVLLSLLDCYDYASFYWHHVLWNLAIFVISDVVIACFLRRCRSLHEHTLIFHIAGSDLIHVSFYDSYFTRSLKQHDYICIFSWPPSHPTVKSG